MKRKNIFVIIVMCAVVSLAAQNMSVHLDNTQLADISLDNVKVLVDAPKRLDCEDITQNFYNDFAKYKKRANVLLIQEVFGAMIEQTGEKFTYSKASTTTSTNGLPLPAEQNTKFRKYLIFDTGIYQRYLKLNLSGSFSADKIEQVNKGAFAELLAGLEIKKASPVNFPLSLHYWQREKTGSNAEVDYVVQQNENIVPVEINANTKGSMQSMFQFLAEKGYPYGIRSSMENFGMYENIRIYPLYAIAQAVE